MYLSLSVFGSGKKGRFFNTSSAFWAPCFDDPEHLRVPIEDSICRHVQAERKLSAIQELTE